MPRGQRSVIKTVPAPALAAEIVRAARRPNAARALVLDLDGTLAPIAPRPKDAEVPAVVLKTLERLLANGWRVAVVSGRPLVQARRMVPVPGVTVFGSHGIERGEPFPASRALRALSLRSERIARQARGFVRGFPGVLLERKPYGCAFHHRALAAATRPRFLRRLAVWLAERDTRGLEVLDGRCVVELRPAGLGKGLVARRWPAARSAVPGDRSLVAIGDDRTDEDLFAAFEDRGITVSVGSKRSRTIARRRLPGTAAVARLLTALAETGHLERRDVRG